MTCKNGGDGSHSRSHSSKIRNISGPLATWQTVQTLYMYDFIKPVLHDVNTILFSFYTWGNGGIEKLSNLLNIAQLVTGRSGILTQRTVNTSTAASLNPSFSFSTNTQCSWHLVFSNLLNTVKLWISSSFLQWLVFFYIFFLPSSPIPFTMEAPQKQTSRTYPVLEPHWPT